MAVSTSSAALNFVPSASPAHAPASKAWCVRPPSARRTEKSSVPRTKKASGTSAV